MNREIQLHQGVQELQGQVHEVFQFAMQKGFTAKRVQSAIKTMFDFGNTERFRKEYLFAKPKSRETEICGGCGRTKKACQLAGGSGCDRK